MGGPRLSFDSSIKGNQDDPHPFLGMGGYRRCDARLEHDRLWIKPDRWNHHSGEQLLDRGDNGNKSGECRRTRHGSRRRDGSSRKNGWTARRHGDGSRLKSWDGRSARRQSGDGNAARCECTSGSWLSASRSTHGGWPRDGRSTKWTGWKARHGDGPRHDGNG